ncbi:MAG: flagellar hook-basal body complex protein, partial [Deferribacterales bacterium]|nr:flagellar hook-basal body complex protein [Deferribacterales bacterium]
MLRSLYAGVTGLQQHQKSMDVVGNNIANVNTVGYKGSRVVFSDLMSQTLSVAKAPGDGTGGVNAKQIGLGSKLGAIDVNFNQGTLQTTGVTTDLALQGDGFFVVKSSNTEQAYYTRAGNFTFDKSGYLVTPSGLIVQGWLRDLENNTLSANGPASDIRIDESYKVIEPRATTEVKIAGNISTEASPT